MPSQKRLFRNIQRHIKVTEKEITILFTDVVGSGRYWDSRGDVMGRLMIDFLNRLIFPIIRNNRGRVIKTLGDSVMASFRRPNHALKAAVVIQQVLRHERKTDSKIPKIRIGIHTGRAVVEKQDIYGDTVNVAKRIEGRCLADQILISAQTAKKLRRRSFILKKTGPFKPKGKKTPIILYQCLWQKMKHTVPDDQPVLTLGRLQKWELFAAGLIGLCMLVFLFYRYFRFFLADTEALALLLLNPGGQIMQSPFLAVIPGLFLACGIFLMIRIRRAPMAGFRSLSGGIGFALGFILFSGFAAWYPGDIGLNQDRVLYESGHRFVEIQAMHVPIRKNPSENAAVIRSVNRGMLLLYADVIRSADQAWNRVMISKGTYGYVLQIQPPRIGVAEKRISIVKKFQFHVRDAGSFAAGFIGFVIGFFAFRLRAA
ncbi:adenylate/guanylate cyclase domain-containing protein [bacterium]|nr:adenylate/guanylate cyclase domain-containing protein [bacterium]